jgi:hypothetical protein
MFGFRCSAAHLHDSSRVFARSRRILLFEQEPSSQPFRDAPLSACSSSNLEDAFPGLALFSAQLLQRHKWLIMFSIIDRSPAQEMLAYRGAMFSIEILGCDEVSRSLTKCINCQSPPLCRCFEANAYYPIPRMIFRRNHMYLTQVVASQKEEHRSLKANRFLRPNSQPRRIHRKDS